MEVLVMKKWLLIISATVICVAAAFLYFFSLTPKGDTITSRESILNTAISKGNEWTIAKELELGGYIVSGAYSADNKSTLAIFEPTGNGDYKFSTSTNRNSDEIIVGGVAINGEWYDLIWFNGAKTEYAEITYVLIGLMQLGTRCSDGSCEAAEDLISGFSAIEAEAELVQIGLKLCAAAVISAEQECFQVADGFVQPVQVARFILFRVQLHARQVLIASVAVAFDFCTCRNSFADDLLKCFARDVFHDLHPREQRSPVFRF